LAVVALSSEVNSLGIDLIGDINEEDFKELVVDLVRSEYYFDCSSIVSRNSFFSRHEGEGKLLALVSDSIN
jgi:hypothetical protein